MRSSLHRTETWLTGLVLSMLCAASPAQDIARLAQVADTLAKDRQFSGTVLVAQGDRILLDRAYGEANAEWGRRNESTTRFRIGSLTKQFTAASVLMLQDQGKLKLTDTIGRYLPDLPPAWRPVTIMQLLTHTSGIHSFTEVPAYANLERFTRTPRDILATVRDLPLDFAPGSRYDYSNTGYLLLGMLIEKAGGEPYARFLQRRIFDPLGMRDSGYDSNAAIIPRRASGYADHGHGLVNADFIDMSVPFSAGALYSTTGDLLRWQRALYGGKVLSPSSLQAMTTPFRDGYALGLMVQDGPDGKQIGHGGAIEGFRSQLGYRPAERLSVILLSNVEGTELEPIEHTLFDVARGKTVLLPSERTAVALAPGQRDRLVGVYALPDGTKFRVKVEGDGLVVRLGSQPWLPVLAESDDRLFARTVDVQFEVMRAGNGAVEALVLVQNGQRLRMVRSVDTAPDFATVPFFLRGDMNDWGTANPMRKIGAHTFAATLKLDAQRYVFKFGSDDFKAIDFGAFRNQENVALDAGARLDENGENMQLALPEAGNYRFVLDTADARAPVLTVTRQ